MHFTMSETQVRILYFDNNREKTLFVFFFTDDNDITCMICRTIFPHTIFYSIFSLTFLTQWTTEIKYTSVITTVTFLEQGKRMKFEKKTLVTTIKGRRRN